MSGIPLAKCVLYVYQIVEKEYNWLEANIIQGKMTYYFYLLFIHQNWPSLS
jgi:hypothetical protein